MVSNLYCAPCKVHAEEGSQIGESNKRIPVPFFLMRLLSQETFNNGYFLHTVHFAILVGKIFMELKKSPLIDLNK